MSKENLDEKDCIRTFKGIYVNVFEPTVEMFNIRDIAHALSNIPRFGGHTKIPYSVAQHSVMVARFVKPEHAIEALLHDASEAYILDMPSPIKHKMPEYMELESKIMSVIAKKFGFQFPLSNEVKIEDRKQLEHEWEGLILKSKHITIWDNVQSEKEFMYAYNKYNRLKQWSFSF